ncbi:MAG: ATP-binding protein [Acidobacteriota bacterium]
MSSDPGARKQGNVGAMAAGKPLAEALASLARSFTSETGIRVSFQSSVKSPLPLSTEAELYRITEEALNNIRQHARAHSASIRLEDHRKRLRLSIADDGTGMIRRSKQGERHGIVGMRERAALIGGTLRITSGKSRGTTVIVSAPVDEAS